MTLTRALLAECFEYLEKHAPVLFFVLSKTGVIVKTNEYVTHFTGRDVTGNAFQETIVDFSGKFELSAFVHLQDREHLINVSNSSGYPQTFYFTFKSLDEYVLAFGRVDFKELEEMHEAVLSLNRELNNMTRELHKKNADLKRLNHELQIANDRITELTRTDPLTHLNNRRYFDERIKEMVSLAKRRLQPLSIIITDIDKFKHVNDTFGHDAGDRVLVGYADIMKKSTRGEDFVARFGGEEFIILLPLTSSREAHPVAERMRKTLSKTDLLGNKHFVTASYGISQLKPDENIANFIKRADTALYQAKKSGRNQTVVAE